MPLTPYPLAVLNRSLTDASNAVQDLKDDDKPVRAHLTRHIEALDRAVDEAMGHLRSIEEYILGREEE